MLLEKRIKLIKFLNAATAEDWNQMKWTNLTIPVVMLTVYEIKYSYIYIVFWLTSSDFYQYSIEVCSDLFWFIWMFICISWSESCRICE